MYNAKSEVKTNVKMILIFKSLMYLSLLGSLFIQMVSGYYLVFFHFSSEYSF